MPVKLRRAKKAAYRITDEVLDAFVTARDTDATYVACIRGEGCFAAAATGHCETCSRHLEARRTLHRLLHLPPWRPCVTHITDESEDPEVWEMKQAIEAKLAERAKA